MLQCQLKHIRKKKSNHNCWSQGHSRCPQPPPALAFAKASLQPPASSQIRAMTRQSYVSSAVRNNGCCQQIRKLLSSVRYCAKSLFRKVRLQSRSCDISGFKKGLVEWMSYEVCGSTHHSAYLPESRECVF